MDYYDYLAPGYDELHQEEQLKKLGLIIGRLRQERLAEGPVVDVGCGTGFSLDRIAAATQHACIGVEPSKGMAAQYKGKQQLIIGCAESLPFPDCFAAAIVSVTAAQNFSDVARSIAEMTRVTKPGGPLIISCLKRSLLVKEVAASLAEAVVVEEVVEEEKDLIFCCRRSEGLNISRAW